MRLNLRTLKRRHSHKANTCLRTAGDNPYVSVACSRLRIRAEVITSFQQLRSDMLKIMMNAKPADQSLSRSLPLTRIKIKLVARLRVHSLVIQGK